MLVWSVNIDLEFRFVSMPGTVRLIFGLIRCAGYKVPLIFELFDGVVCDQLPALSLSHFVFFSGCWFWRLGSVPLVPGRRHWCWSILGVRATWQGALRHDRLSLAEPGQTARADQAPDTIARPITSHRTASDFINTDFWLQDRFCAQSMCRNSCRTISYQFDPMRAWNCRKIVAVLDLKSRWFSLDCLCRCEQNLLRISNVRKTDTFCKCPRIMVLIFWTIRRGLSTPSKWRRSRIHRSYTL